MPCPNARPSATLMTGLYKITLGTQLHCSISLESSSAMPACPPVTVCNGGAELPMNRKLTSGRFKYTKSLSSQTFFLVWPHCNLSVVTEDSSLLSIHHVQTCHGFREVRAAHHRARDDGQIGNNIVFYRCLFRQQWLLCLCLTLV